MYLTINLNYRGMKTRIVLIILLTFVAGASISGQQNKKKITIRGLIVGSDQKPVANAIIVIDKKKTGYISNQDGTYKIKVKLSAKTIGIFTDKTGVIDEAINGRTTINFTLAVSFDQQSVNQQNLNEEEEIDIGYGSVKKKDLTQPVSKLDGRNNRYASYTSIYEMIKGEIPGVRVIGTSINIQGSLSIYASTEPLIVVDGVATESIDNISPQMVRSIEVLKGSSATIYGTRGANGVILINLKGAKDNR
jgi:TonB-dependent starch-binding outer membrane protein SusC